MSNMFPEVRDVSTLTGVLNLDQFMTIGIEGQKDTVGTGVVGTSYLITDPATADTLFGPVSSLGKLVKYVLSQGINFVWAVAAASNLTPTLVQRQAAWTALEENVDVRIRLTDSMVQADLAALADSCEWAEGIQNKQFAVCGLATPTTSANLTTASAAISSKRALLVGPGFYDDNGVLNQGNYVAARIACEIAKNPDITDDMDTMSLAATTGLEKDTNGLPLFRQKAGAGTPTNDFATLLAAGVSPLRLGRDGTAEIVHLRMTYVTDTTYDALMTLLIRDQLFIDIRAAVLAPDVKALRRGNTADTRALISQIVDGVIRARQAWVQPKKLPNGTLGYGVTVIISSDKRNITISYVGEIVRNLQKIDVNGQLTIPA